MNEVAKSITHEIGIERESLVQHTIRIGDKDLWGKIIKRWLTNLRLELARHRLALTARLNARLFLAKPKIVKVAQLFSRFRGQQIKYEISSQNVSDLIEQDEFRPWARASFAGPYER